MALERHARARRTSSRSRGGLTDEEQEILASRHSERRLSQKARPADSPWWS